MTTTTKITSNYSDVSGKPEVDSIVVATLIGPTSYSGGSVDRQITTRVDVNGNWTLSLFPNQLFSGDSYYVIRLANKEEYQIIVPNSVDIIPVTSLLLKESPSFNYIGNLTLSSNVVVRGNVNVSGILTVASITQIPVAIAEQFPPTFWYDINITGNLTIGGQLTYSGNIAYAAIVNTGP